MDPGSVILHLFSIGRHLSSLRCAHTHTHTQHNISTQQVLKYYIFWGLSETQISFSYKVPFFSMMLCSRERGWKQDKMTKDGKKMAEMKKNNKEWIVCTRLCSWSISTTSDSRLESASCSNLSGAFWGDSMCCSRDGEMKELQRHDWQIFTHS